MHEYALIDGLLRRVEEEARRRGAIAVRAVKVTIGELAGVDPELFRTAYETFRAGTACERAALDLATVTARWSCPGCGRSFARGEPLRCGSCQRSAEMNPNGDALVLEAIEMEVP